jgi:hypothetical protein
MKTNQKNILITAASFLWFFVIILLYYLTHKPFSPAQLAALLTTVWSLLAALLITALAGGIGRKLLPWLNESGISGLTQQAAAGYGILALGILILGGTIGHLKILLPAGMVILFLVFIRSITGWLRGWNSLRALWVESDRFCRTLAVFSLLLIAIPLVSAAAPPFHYDALMYHLTMPAAYLQLDKVAYLPWIAMSGMPQNGEMLYTLSTALGGLQAAALLGWLGGILTLAGLWDYLAKTWGVKPAWIGVSSLLAGSSLVNALGWGYIDWWSALFGFGMLTSLDAWVRGGDRKSVLLAGIFAGLAAGCKYPSAVAGAAGAVVVLAVVIKYRRSFWSSVLYFGGGAVIAFAAWPVKNLITTGNPLYPFFFPSGAMDAVRIAVYQGNPTWGTWADFFLLPVRATYMGVEGASGYSMSIGPLLAGLGLLALFVRPREDEEKRASLLTAAVLALTGLAVWAVGNRVSGYLIQTRFYFSLFPAFAVLAGAGYSAVEQIRLPQVRVSRLVNALVIFVMVMTLVDLGASAAKQGAWKVIWNGETQEQYLEDNLGWYQVAVSAINDLPQGSRVLMLYEPRSLYCLPKCQGDEILDRWKVESLHLTNDAAIRQDWISQGYTHLLVNRAGVEFLKTDHDPHHPLSDLARLDTFLKTLPAPQQFGDGYELYALK